MNDQGKKFAKAAVEAELESRLQQDRATADTLRVRLAVMGVRIDRAKQASLAAEHAFEAAMGRGHADQAPRPSTEPRGRSSCPF